MQAQFHGVYFSVNGFKHKRTKEDLLNFNGYYVDLDIKKETDTLSPEKCQELKTGALNKLTGAPLQPHCIVETKNGYQAVWLISDQLDKSTYIQIEKELISYFGADKAGTSVTKILRLPGFYHLKNPNEPFLCKLVINNFDQEKFTSDLIVEKFGFSLAEEKAEPQLAGSSSSFTVPIKTVIEKTAGMVGIKIDFRKNPDGSEQIIENGEMTSGFISSRGEFVESASGKERRGNNLGIAKYYLNVAGNNNYSVRELYEIIRSLENNEPLVKCEEFDIYDYIIDYSSLLSMKLNQAEFIIDDILPEKGITMLQGHPDSYKSWLALYFSYCIITKKKVFDVYGVKQINILIVNVDDNIDTIKDRLANLELNEKNTNKLYFWGKPNFDILEHRDLLKKITKDKNIGLIIFDTFRDIHEKDENDSYQMSLVMKALKELAIDCSVLLIHHQNKDSKSGLLSGRGSTAIAGSLVSLLSAKNNNTDKTIQITQLKNKLRGKIKPFFIIFSAKKRPFKFYITQDKQKPLLDEVCQKIIKEAEKIEGHFQKDVIVEKTKEQYKIPITAIKKAFSYLIKENVIARENKNYSSNRKYYILVSSKTSSSPPQPP